MPGPLYGAHPKRARRTRNQAYQERLASPTRATARPSSSAPSIAVRSGTYTGTQPKAQRRSQRVQRVNAALARVQKTFSHPGGVSGPGISKGESKFYGALGRKTGLSPRVLAAQGTQEGGADEDYNILNIGRTDSGDLSISHDPRFRSPKSGASLTAKFFKGKEGGASPGIQNILRSAGKPEGEQVRAIAGSGWATDPKYAQGISSILPSVKSKPKVKPAKKDLKTLKKAGVSPKVAPAKAASKPTPAIKPEAAKRFQKIEKAANSVAGVPYVWGGGHGSIEKNPSGLDCSGAVSKVLHAAGVLNTPLTSGAMGQVLKPGPGAVSVYYNDGHTFMKIGNKYWGTSVGDSGSGGLGEHPAPSGGYLSEYNVGHVPGLGKKAAAAMGVKLTSGGSPGATGSIGGGTSSGGTTTTVNGGTIKTAPGFSNHPIKALTPKQKLNQVRERFGGDATETETSGASEAIRRRHGKPVV